MNVFAISYAFIQASLYVNIMRKNCLHSERGKLSFRRSVLKHDAFSKKRQAGINMDDHDEYHTWAQGPV